MEDVDSQSIPVLRAGLTKLLQSGKKNLVLDMLGAKVVSEDSWKDISSLLMTAMENDGYLALVCKKEGVANAASVDEALHLLKAGQLKGFGLEERLRLQKDRLEKKKSDLLTQIAAAEAASPEVRKLKKEGSRLRARIETMESHIDSLVAKRPAGQPPAPGDAMKTLDQLLSSVLSQEGILPVK